MRGQDVFGVCLRARAASEEWQYGSAEPFLGIGVEDRAWQQREEQEDDDGHRNNDQAAPALAAQLAPPAGVFGRYVLQVGFAHHTVFCFIGRYMFAYGAYFHIRCQPDPFFCLILVPSKKQQVFF